ncbi:hypothetical protein KCH_23780 [Kitasatospora cheerisanensis KCTC 2395]|uniref:Uncharacterized protein n=1 Tax=Kitasatospora cheerisanensis KCTC 2395 TaxID=1348663 RepID=A0A066YX91_9ACTN|nr:hypothetical protein KCH_23780 [Kitasatospora cheerisanensis KCTC 2395]
MEEHDVWGPPEVGDGLLHRLVERGRVQRVAGAVEPDLGRDRELR